MTRKTPTPEPASDAMREARHLAVGLGHQLPRFIESRGMGAAERSWHTGRCRAEDCKATARVAEDGRITGAAVIDLCGPNTPAGIDDDDRAELNRLIARAAAGLAPAPSTTAIVEGRANGSALIRLPAVHPHRILTIPAVGALADVTRGDQLPVTVSTPIVPSPAGWSATITPISQGGIR